MTYANHLPDDRRINDAVAAAAAQVRADDGRENLPEPAPLPKLPTVPELPPEILPDDLRPWILDAADRARFRPDFAAVAGMAALGAVIGRKLGIRPKARDDWTEHANLWGLIIGPPSALKSPAMGEALRPFKALQAAADEKHQEACAEYERTRELWKLKRDARKKAAAKALSTDADAEVDLGDDEPEPPTSRTYWTSNANEASLGALLKVNPDGVLIERDEISALLTGLEDDHKADLRGLLLSGWSGRESYRFDRIARGVVSIPKFAVSVLGGIQPGPVARYVRSAAMGERADGLLQRFQLAVWPDQAAYEYIDRYPDQGAREAARDLFQRIDTIDPDDFGNRDNYGDGPPCIRLDDEAQGIFADWLTGFMREQRNSESVSAPLANHFGKYPGLVGKLALILHVADEPGKRLVSARTLAKALAWLEYLTPHAQRLYHAVENPETGAAEMLLARIKRGDLSGTFKARDVYRKGWHGLTDREAVKRACAVLADYGWLVEVSTEDRPGPGRPADPVYRVNPAIERVSP